MSNALDRVRLAVGEIIVGIDIPCGSRAWMLGPQDAIQHRVTQVDIARRHVDLGAQHAAAVGEFARLHAPEQVEVFFCATVTEGACLAGFGQGAAHLADLIRRLVIYIGVAALNQVFGPFIQLVEIIRCVKKVFAPVEAEPVHIGLDGVDIFLFFLGRVGVVEA